MVQNKLARFLNAKKLRDKVPTIELLKHINMLSVNQLNAKIKLIEIWKALNIEKYPLKIPTQSISDEQMNTRAMTSSRPIENEASCLIAKSCVSYAIKLWSKAPLELKNCKSLYSVKKLARAFALTLRCVKFFYCMHSYQFVLKLNSFMFSLSIHVHYSFTKAFNCA